ncbi:MAG: hypothetical protein ABSG10_13035 [Terracidiphilus sp.]
MRRGFSIFLIVLFGLGPLSAALQASDESRLPSCCRRHGAHHCAMAAQMASSAAQDESGSTPAVSAPLTCPYYPGARGAMLTSVHALAVAPAGVQAVLIRMLALVPGPAAALSSPSYAHAGRGPPAANLS